MSQSLRNLLSGLLSVAVGLACAAFAQAAYLFVGEDNASDGVAVHRWVISGPSDKMGSDHVRFPSARPSGFAFSSAVSANEFFMGTTSSSDGADIARCTNAFSPTPSFDQDGPISSTEFGSPILSLANVPGSSDLYVAGAGHGRGQHLARITPTVRGARVVYQLDLAPVAPRGITVSPGGEIFVSDGVGTIYRYIDTGASFKPNGSFTGGDMYGPHGLAFRKHELFVANRGGNSVSRFTFSSNDTGSTAIVGALITGNELAGAVGLAVAPWGELFVANAGSTTPDMYVVSRFTFAGGEGSLASPNGTFLFDDGSSHSATLAIAFYEPVPESPTVALEFFETKVRPLLVDNCQHCHGPDTQESDLRLDHISAILKGGKRGAAIVPGEPGKSFLLDAVSYIHTDIKMPPDGKLPEEAVSVLEYWIKSGAPWPDEPPPAGIASSSDNRSKVKHDQWWRTPIGRPQPPPVQDAAWPRTDVDRFILARLEAKGLRPAPSADRRTLIRRAYFDLIGLPPTPQEVEEFVEDSAPQAFERVVERLLASPHYGERWGRHWLDTVRYTDDIRTGQTIMSLNYRYRDWVVGAFNRDLPYDQFIIQQVAGDLQPPVPPAEVNVEGIIATGVFSLGEWSALDADVQKMLSDIVDDQIDVVGRAFLGITFACARCHDHKFDPITTKDYYGLAGIFFSSHIIMRTGSGGGDVPMNRIPLVPAEQVEARSAWQQQVVELEKKIAALTPPQGQPAANAEELTTITQLLTALKQREPPAYPVAHGLQEGGTPGTQYEGLRDAPIFVRGKYDRHGEIVPRHMPALLADEKPMPISSGSGRADLARWLADAKNPLPARVMANRIWQGHFLTGIVRSSTNFGALGTPPSHPDLLDYLAAEFIESGWSIKALHRLIMLSSAYQQASLADPQTRAMDSDNELFSRMPRRRMETEVLRDTLLAANGTLDRTLGGPSIEQPDHNRRMLYSHVERDQQVGFRQIFDTANAMTIIEKRGDSTSAAQALYLLNNSWMMEQAKALSKRLLREAPADDPGKVQWLYAVLYGRPAEPHEVELGLAAAASARAKAQTAFTDRAQLDPKGRLSGLIETVVTEQAWEPYCQALFCTNEFLYID